MEKNFLEKIRRLNWVLCESTTGKLSYGELCGNLSEIVNANFYVFDRNGFVLGAAYTKASDTSTFEDEPGVEKISESDNSNMLGIKETYANMIGEKLKYMFGENYEMTDKYHTLVPSVCGGERMGTILLARYDEPFTDEEIVLAEYGAAVVGLEIRRNERLKKEKEQALETAVKMALYTLSNSEKDALEKIIPEMPGDEGNIVASKIAAKYGLTNSVIVSALKKLESAGILETKSLGMKGTYIKILNPHVRSLI